MNNPQDSRENKLGYPSARPLALACLGCLGDRVICQLPGMREDGRNSKRKCPYTPVSLKGTLARCGRAGARPHISMSEGGSDGWQAHRYSGQDAAGKTGRDRSNHCQAPHLDLVHGGRTLNPQGQRAASAKGWEGAKV